MIVRSKVGDLPDKDLSDYIIKHVYKDAMLIGLAQLAFLIFSSIQCEGNKSNYKDCNRTLYSQSGLGLLVATFTIIQLVGGIFPKHILEKHVVSIKKVVSMNMNAQEKFQAFGFLIVAACVMFLLSAYGSEGDFNNEAEGHFMICMVLLGWGCLFLIAAWNFSVIRQELKREE